MNKGKNLLVIPFVLIIFFSIFSGFSPKNNEHSIAKELIRERAFVMQKLYSNQIDLSKAEELLYEIETQPLLSSDIRSLREYKDTEMDVVKEIEIMSLNPVSSIYGYKSFTSDILWHMKGTKGEYVQSVDYSIVIKKIGKGYKISEFSPLTQ